MLSAPVLAALAFAFDDSVYGGSSDAEEVAELGCAVLTRRRGAA